MARVLLELLLILGGVALGWVVFKIAISPGEKRWKQEMREWDERLEALKAIARPSPIYEPWSTRQWAAALNRANTASVVSSYRRHGP